MHHGEVIGVEEVLGCELPVGLDDVFVGGERPQLLGVPAGEPLVEGSNEVREGLSLPREIDEHHVAPEGAAQRDQSEPGALLGVGLAPVAIAVEVRCERQLAGEVVAPRVVGAHDASPPRAAGLGHETRSAVATQVVVDPDLP